LLFTAPAAAPSATAVQNADVAPVVEQKEIAETAAKVLEIARAFEPAPVPAKPQEPAKSLIAPATSSLDEAELQIPAWLAPLARNAAAPASTQELIEREKARRLAEQPEADEIAAESVAAMEEHEIPELPLPTFSDTLAIDEVKSAGESGSRSSSKGVLFAAIAAGVLLLASGVWWYMRPQSGPVHAGAAPSSNVQASVASLPGVSSPSQPQRNAPPQTNPPAQINPAAQTNTQAESNSASNSVSVVPVAASAHNSQPSSNLSNVGANVTTASSTQPAAVPEKKSILGEAHLSTPKVTPSRNAQNGAEADAGIALSNDDQPESGTEALNGGLASSNKQPAAPVAPLPVGGDVVPAKQISSVPPSYPTLARNQRVSGNVVIDALIDANGRVTTMKAISGPTLLHQAAMDALKQWKYQPASLNGQAVPMHLNVTIQFRLQ
jgi:TonB family protein